MSTHELIPEREVLAIIVIEVPVMDDMVVCVQQPACVVHINHIVDGDRP